MEAESVGHGRLSEGVLRETPENRYIRMAGERGRRINLDKFREVDGEVRSLLSAMLEEIAEGKESPYCVFHVDDGIHYFAKVDGEVCYVTFLTVEELKLLGYSDRNAEFREVEK